MSIGTSDFCEGCDVLYSDARRPHVLGCGHSLCCSCLTFKIETEDLSCRFCRKVFSASCTSDIPINYSLENCVSSLRKLRRPGLTPEAIPSSTGKSSHSVQKLIDYQKQSAQDLILSSKDLVEDLTKYRDFVNRNMLKHIEIRRLIQDRAQHHRTISEQMDIKQDSVMEVKKQLDARIKKLSGDLFELDNAYETEDIAAAVTCVTEKYHELANFVDSCQGDYPDVEMPVYQKLLYVSMKVLYRKDFEQLKRVTYMHQCPFDDPSIMDKANLCKIEGFVTVDNLKSDVEMWKERIHRCALVAASWDNKQTRITYLAKENDQIYLNCLYDGFPCAEEYVIEHKEILTCVKSDSPVAFLELAWDDKRKGRVLIGLCRDNPMAEHFKGLCTGELGPTYLEKELNNVLNPDTVTEKIASGPCKGTFFHGDISKDTLGFNSAAYKCQADQGIIWMDTNLSFSILIGVGKGCVYNNVFGQVIEGLDLLIDSAKRVKTGLGKVRIVNSGVILEIQASV